MKALISGVPGFVSYAAVRGGVGGVTVTVCEDKAGTDESARRAADWVKENLADRIKLREQHTGDIAWDESA